ncbi:hypothetical protein FHR83_006812 [Actinoplanes campanulatus]|uniref:Uncharacterized protein n=1 Tax=Actinoplanes campanulatus TaxID=113559 RepID=A0A7W5AMN4_9ACTN|nr:hypothetical protein [Actinoplanes campanulatus]MBB3099106.1 hypothetical protein [Actinoplanes campanulatus]GGN39027.1 hypothetical protein GCM10010109_66470 [Actinoplanes campanulatus]GID40262.1 hypothetical protein Aca09nite_67680 [Actinoplanes campanulatus]
MSEFITEEQFLNLVADRLATQPNIEFDGQTDQITGNLADIAVIVLDVHSEHGPVLFGD